VKEIRAAEGQNYSLRQIEDWVSNTCLKQEEWVWVVTICDLKNYSIYDQKVRNEHEETR
jgi:hypothetical protein